jgi:hypothetical protein
MADVDRVLDDALGYSGPTFITIDRSGKSADTKG